MNLVEFQKLSGLQSHQQIAMALGVSLSTVDSWSLGRRNPNRWNQLEMKTFLEKKNAQEARFAQLRARRLSGSDLDRVIEAGNY